MEVGPKIGVGHCRKFRPCATAYSVSVINRTGLSYPWEVVREVLPEFSEDDRKVLGFAVSWNRDGSLQLRSTRVRLFGR